LPPLPPELGHVWAAFNRLSRRRGSNGFGPNPIGWPEIDAFMRRTGVKLVPFEIEIIEDFDDLFRAECAKALSDKATT